MVSLAPPTLDLSVVIPVHDELPNLAPLLVELREALEASRRSWEIVFVDDASGDGSGDALREAACADERVRVIALARRGGQSAAIVTGFAHVRGAVIVTLDADLQNDPRDLPRVLEALERADVVSGVRTHREDSALRRMSSSIANATRRAVIGDTVTDIGCSFKAYRREALALLPPFVGAHRFLPALCQFRGARLAEVPLAHRPRRHGVSKYGISNRLWRGLYDLVGVRWLKSRLVALPPADSEVTCRKQPTRS
jgi:glycosyltransferase involved in cell wall biosynthesis